MLRIVAPLALLAACASSPPEPENPDDLVLFAPARGPGYEDVPLAAETAPETSTSYLRRDLMAIIADAATAALADDPDDLRPVALGDMSDRNGDTPGTLAGHPRHPAHTHERGRDIDIAYFQNSTPNNYLRPICPHFYPDGTDAYHCLGPPTTLDVDRTARFIGSVLASPRVRIVIVDGMVAPFIRHDLTALCRAGDVAQEACDRAPNHLVDEVTDTGRGLFYSHHTHFHVSLLP